MKKFNLFSIIILIILFSLVVSSTSYAIPLKFIDVNPGEVATANGERVWAGIYNLEVGNDYKPYDSFCIEFDQWAPTQEEEYNFQSLDLVYSSQVANDIAELWYDNYSANISSRDAAGLQIAIWEVTKDDFFITGEDYGAQNMLSNLDGSGFATLIALTNSEKQDYVVAQQPVPEPATLFLLGTGLLGLAGYGRKKGFKKS